MSNALVTNDRSHGLSDTARVRLLVLAWVVGLASYVAILTQTIGFETFSAAQFCVSAVGTILVLRRPGNVIGPLLVVVGMGWTLVTAADVTADTLASGGDVVAASWVALVANMATVPLLWVRTWPCGCCSPTAGLELQGSVVSSSSAVSGRLPG